MRYLLLHKNDWNRPGGVGPADAKPYPAETVEEFVNWLRTTSAWRSNPEAMIHKASLMLRKLDKIGPLASETVPAALVIPSLTTTSEGMSAPAVQANLCPDCDRTFKLPMHLGTHRKKAHPVAV